MINYNYLSCTDYDGKTKEINFCSETLPDTASEDYKILCVHTDTENPTLLHVRTKEFIEPYPIGAIYLSVSDTNPGVLFGGTWEPIKDKFLLAAGDSYTAGSEGGSPTHTLTIAEMPTHSHTISGYSSSGGEASGVSGGNTITAPYTVMTNSAGLGKPHNNMPPYITVYIWKRVA